MSAPRLPGMICPRRLPISLLLLCIFLCPCTAPSLHAQPEADRETDEEVLRGAQLAGDGRSLLEVFRKRIPDAQTQKHISLLIAQLGSASFAEREDASEELAHYGITAAGLLREATRHRDLEIRRRAREALALIEQDELSEEVLIAALHQLARRKPPRMAEVLLAYARHSAGAEVTEALRLALVAVAVREGEADPVLVRALNAKSAVQRGVAGVALCRAGCRKQLPAVRELLRDRDARVRRRVALALLEARDKAAVPVLIDLLAELPLAQSEQIESVLLQLGGDLSPSQPEEDETRRKLRDAWAGWWKKHQDTLDLAKVELVPRWRGYTLAVCYAAVRGRGRTGCILEFDSRGRIRWQMQGLDMPVAAEVLDERRVLVTEYRAGQVTERNHQGDILRRIDVPEQPLDARRLPNGNTFVVTRSEVLEVNRAGKEVWKIGPGLGTIVAACPLRGGQLAVCLLTGEVVRLDRSGKVLAQSDVGRRFRPYGTHIEGLPNGHILIPLYYDNKVVEVDGKCREVWSVSHARPTCAQRLPNGRTLVTGYASSTIVELDREGREVKSQRCDGRLMSAQAR